MEKIGRIAGRYGGQYLRTNPCSRASRNSLSGLFQRRIGQPRMVQRSNGCVRFVVDRDVFQLHRFVQSKARPSYEELQRVYEICLTRLERARNWPRSSNRQALREGLELLARDIQSLQLIQRGFYSEMLVDRIRKMSQRDGGEGLSEGKQRELGALLESLSEEAEVIKELDPISLGTILLPRLENKLTKVVDAFDN